MPLRPGEGERGAAGGFNAQYRVAADIILRELNGHRFEWIRVADPEAGRVDDLLVGTLHRVDAYQIKWPTHVKAITFQQFTKSEDLAAELVDGWQRLRYTYGQQRRIVVHLLTNQVPSVSDRVPINESVPPREQHFAAFLSQAWYPAHSQPDFSVPTEWAKAWDELCEATGLSSDEFTLFVRDCVLDLSYKDPIPEWSEAGPEANAQHDDVKSLAGELWEIAASSQREVQIGRSSLLRRLNWTQRYEFRNQHDFPVEQRLYRPITETIQELEAAIDQSTSGYVGLFGSPGSGKSTLLTQLLRETRSEQIIPYYAYVPDAQDPTVLRGETENFLHDVIQALHRAGFYPTSLSYPPTSRNQQLDFFAAQLQILSQHWDQHHQKTIILVDGLDHIDREQHPARPLMKDLPQPDRVPDGVIFVLGSQTDSALPHRIRSQINRDGRRVEMGRLKHEEIIDILTVTNLKDRLKDDQVLDVVRLADGHPLALRYLISQLDISETADELDQVLNETLPFSGDIEDQYSSYWGHIADDDDDLARLLSIAARLRRPVDLSLLRTWFDSPLISKLRRTSSHFFRVERDEQWTFFHNSFRLFILDRTGPVGSIQDRELHLKLVKLLTSTSDAPWKWESIYHSEMAEDDQRVVDLATQEYFREQVFELRSLDAIMTDIRIGIRSAGRLQDTVALAQLVFIGAETERRMDHLDFASISVPPLVLDLGEADIAFDQIMDGNQLRVRRRIALESVQKLVEFDMESEARRIYDLAVPWDLISSNGPVEIDREEGQRELLVAWAETTPLFDKTEAIVSTIRGLRAASRFRPPMSVSEDDEETRYLQAQLLFHVGKSLITNGLWDEIDRLSSSFDLSNDEDREWWLYLRAYLWNRAKDNGDAISYVENTLVGLDPASIRSLDLRLLIADGIVRILGDPTLAIEWLDGSEIPDLSTGNFGAEAGMQPFDALFNYVRLRHLIGDTPDLTKIITDTPETRQSGLFFFERAVCSIARIWASGLSDSLEPSDDLHQDVSNLVRFFHGQSQRSYDWRRYLIRGAQAEFYEYLVEAVAQHGQTALTRMSELFEADWNANQSIENWPHSVRRAVVLAIWRHDAVPHQWVVRHLEAIQDLDYGSIRTVDLLADLLSQAKAWIEIGRGDKARSILLRVLDESFSPRPEKDYQLNHWIDWLVEANYSDPETSIERIAYFAGAVRTYTNVIDPLSRSGRSAAAGLVEAAARSDPSATSALLGWLFDNELIDFIDGVSAAIRGACQAQPNSADDTWFALQDLIIPVATSANADLTTEVTTTLLSYHPDSIALPRVRALVDKICSSALQSTRADWLIGVARALRDSGHDPFKVDQRIESIPASQRPEFDSDRLTLLTDIPMTRSEVEAAVRTVEDLKDLQEWEIVDSNSFSWRPILAPLVKRADLSMLRGLIGLLDQGTVSGWDRKYALPPLGNRAIDLGEYQLARKLATESISLSEPFGWTYWDDNHRIQSLEVMAGVDYQLAEQQTWQLLCDDLSSGRINLREISQEFNRILPLLSSNSHIDEIWPIVADYVQQLLPLTVPAKLEDGIGSHVGAFSRDEEVGSGIPRLLVDHADHPVFEVSLGSRKALIRLLISRNHDVVSIFKSLLVEPESRQEAMLTVLEAVSLEHSSKLESLGPAIAALGASQNAAIRDIAARICERLGSTATQPDIDSQSRLPSIYLIRSPDRVPRRPIGPIRNPRTSGRPTDDDITALWRGYYELVARHSGIESDTLALRAQQISADIERSYPWTSDGVTKLRSRLGAAALRLTYLQPRAFTMWQALLHIVAELDDHGLLPTAARQQIATIIRHHDPRFLLMEPVSRPSQIEIDLFERRPFDTQVHRWVDSVNDGQVPFADVIEDGSLVLAESTTIKRFVVGSPSPIETRLSTVLRAAKLPFEKAVTDDPGQRLYDQSTNRLMESYEQRGQGASKSFLLLRNRALGLGPRGTDWLALHPLIGRRLGWSLSDDGLFRWQDTTGETMVESVWWADGLLNHSQSSRTDEVATGWLVVANSEAIRQMTEKFGTVASYGVVERSVDTQNDSRFARSSEPRLLRIHSIAT